jgi:hypothetical protein
MKEVVVKTRKRTNSSEVQKRNDAFDWLRFEPQPFPVACRRHGIQPCILELFGEQQIKFLNVWFMISRLGLAFSQVLCCFILRLSTIHRKGLLQHPTW